MNEKNYDLNITWLGQAGFVISSGGVKLVVDPYLSDNLRNKGMARTFPPPVTPESLEPDIVCCTHDIPDHFDENTILPIYKRYTGCRILGPQGVIDHCGKLGLNPARTILLKEGNEGFVDNGIIVKAVKAFRPENDAIGLAVTIGKCKIYISGDTARKPGLEEAVIKALGGMPDVAIVCINGKHGNMDDVDAFRVIRTLKPKVAIPMHYGTFVNNTADPHPFVEAVGKIGIEGVMMKPGKKIILSSEVFEQDEEYISQMELTSA